MAKVIAPFKIVGTLDDLNFYIDQDNQNIVRVKGKTGVTSGEFNSNPRYAKVREHGKEFGCAVKKAKCFRMIAQRFNDRAKDGSFSGRCNKLMLEIIQEDMSNPSGERTFENGMLVPEVVTYFVGFEGNKTRPIKKVLKTALDWNESLGAISVKNFNPKTDLDWPEDAEQVHFGLANAHWNYVDDTFETFYSQEVVIGRQEELQTIQLGADYKAPTVGNNIALVFLFIGFSVQERKKTKALKRIHNTVSIIWSR